MMVDHFFFRSPNILKTAAESNGWREFLRA